jgi:glyoxylase-like metal-dependent hydrolase (beta-lactamase superfamily II)
MESMAINKWKYTPVDFNDNIILSIDDSRRFLKEINIFGEIVSTPGHTNDSITLLLDSGEAFVGDLPAENLVVDNDSAERQSWIKLKNSGARIILPGHGRKYETRP